MKKFVALSVFAVAAIVALGQAMPAFAGGDCCKKPKTTNPAPAPAPAPEENA